MISCRVLGPIEVTRDGAPAPAELLWRKNLALLVYLARSPKRTRSRDHLVGLLWGEKPERSARHSLNEAVRVLRKQVGDTGLDSEGGQISLSLDAVELDVDRFESLVGDESWEAATGLVSGDFMEGFGIPGCSAFEDWLYAERVALREKAVLAFVNRAAERLDAGELRQAASVARRALSLDATSEAAARTAMRSLAIAGDRAGALAVYDHLVSRLDEEVGIEPDDETRALAERVRRERTWMLPESAAAAGVGESRRVPLVGREAELAQLIDAWLACRTRRQPTLAFVEGDPGMGKTRLAEELVARARLDGAAVATVRAVEADMEDGWSGLLALARGWSGDLPGLADASPTALAAVAAEIPEWGERFASPSEEVPQLGRAFSQIARSVSDHQPVLLMIDDAQWLDRDSLLALGALLRDLEGRPGFVLIAAATQPKRAELEELRARVGRDLFGVAIQLGPLSPTAIRALSHWALPSYDDVELDRVTRRVATDSAGLPLLAVELIHAVALGLDLNLTGGAWPEPLRTLDQTLPGELPDGVAAAVRVSFRRLSEPAQTLLAAASTLGDRTDVATLARVTGIDDETLAGALDELEWQRWLTAEPRGYSFVARIVRDVVARDMLTSGQRQRIRDAAAG